MEAVTGCLGNNILFVDDREDNISEADSRVMEYHLTTGNDFNKICEGMSHISNQGITKNTV